jgi:hypothetical protein
MSLRKIISLLLCLALAMGVTLLSVSCGKDGGDGTDNDSSDDDTNNTECTVHKDLNKDDKCDVCDAPYSDKVKITVKILNESGDGVSGATVRAIAASGELSLGTTGADGCIIAELKPATYTICIEDLPEYWYITNNYHEFEITATTSSLVFTAINNTPDGSADKPFYAGEGVENALMPAGAAHLYFATGSSRYVIINNANVKLTYNGEDYTADESGVIKVLLTAPESIYERIYFTVTNTLETETTVSITFESLPGSYDNPYAAELDTVTEATVAKEGMVYYKWTAAFGGTLRVSSEDTNNMITLRCGAIVTEASDGGAYVELTVNDGDTVIIEIASKDGISETDTIAFTVTFTETEGEAAEDGDA